jgi:hypothetical protein
VSANVLISLGSEASGNDCRTSDKFPEACPPSVIGSREMEPLERIATVLRFKATLTVEVSKGMIRVCDSGV